jgi:iron transport multicopper oxidase
MTFLIAWIVSFSYFAQNTYAATVTYNWDLGFVEANPDGRVSRPILGINGKFPNPTIEGNIGDDIVVNLNNQTPNETTSIHFHGLYQLNNNAQDGPPGTAVNSKIYFLDSS